MIKQLCRKRYRNVLGSFFFLPILSFSLVLNQMAATSHFSRPTHLFSSFGFREHWGPVNDGNPQRCPNGCGAIVSQVPPPFLSFSIRYRWLINVRLDKSCLLMELSHNNVSDALVRHAPTDASLQRQSQIAETRQAHKMEPLMTRQ